MHSSTRKPDEEELDVYAMTHPGKVRKVNQDHFLVCSLNKRLKIHATSLPRPEQLQFRGERLAFLAMVADGVGGHQAGEEASRLALESIARYVTESMQCYYTHDPDQEQRFLTDLHESVLACHSRVVDEADADPARRGMATTLTLAIGTWPWAFVVQVGDSRCYQLHDGELIQVTKDQTLAQELVDNGIITPADAEGSRYSHVLSSAIGGSAALPRTNRTALHWDDVILLCSDGLTRHVSDERIRKHLMEMKSSKQACRALMDDALAGGGLDNITVVVGRAHALPVATDSTVSPPTG